MPYDKKRFVSETALEWFHKVLAGKAFIPKRGLRPYETQDGSMASMILDRGWWELIAQSEAAVMSIVKEFYVNVKEAWNHVVQVRCKAVSFDKASIKAYYNIEDMSDDDDLSEYI